MSYSRNSFMSKSAIATLLAAMLFGVGAAPAAVAAPKSKPTTDTTTETTDTTTSGGNTKTSGGGRKIG